MMSRPIRNFLCLATLLVAFPAKAGVKNFVPSTGVWNTASNWSPVGVPGTADRVVIQSGQTCTLDVTTTADTLNIEGTATLVIPDGYTLTLENDNDNISPSGADNSVVDGTLAIQGSSTTDAVLRFATATHKVSGGGKITGQQTDHALIKIAAGKRLYNQLAASGKGIRGSMTILSESNLTKGELTNEGLIECGDENNARLVLAADTTLADVSGAIWSVNACKGELVFNEPATTLVGDFVTGSQSGTFEINQNVKTCGSYSRGGGGVNVASGKTFKYAYFIYGGCPNPGTASVDPTGCNYPWSLGSGNTGQCINCPGE
jgi:hypothetical protein